MNSPYEGREQSLVKHEILRRYLQRFALIIGSWKPTISYVDCFSGPWNAQSPGLEDTSFAIALKELRSAREVLAKKGKTLGIRCFFLEENKQAYRRLEEFAKSASDAEIRTKNATLEESVTDISAFLDEDKSSFPFFLIDPTGWTGFELDVIEPLLKREPGEVLVNFMTSFVRRFIDSSDIQTQRSFARTFGPYLPTPESLNGLSSEDRDDLLVRAYMRLLAGVGKFKYISNAIVLHPEIDTTHFRLIYATRDLKGIEVFKDAERRAMILQEDSRATIRGKKLEEEGLLLFGQAAMGRPQHFESLRIRYLSKARADLVAALNEKQRLLYDRAYSLALRHPIVQEADLKTWIKQWVSNGHVEIEGLQAGQKVPQRKHGNSIRLLKEIPDA